MTIPYDCKEIELRGKSFILAPLNFDQLPALSEHFDRIAGVDEPGFAAVVARLTSMATIIHASMSEHQPELSVSDVAKLLNNANASSVFQELTAISGLQFRGEAPAGQLSPA